jgi:N-acetylmuramoyl-L-alanine amidase
MKVKICLDPGHGGKDPGAVGPTGLEEANTVLDISHMISAILTSADIEVLMTRTTDVFIELDKRCEIANDWGANYFVSVHLNSNGSTAVGVETLYKSDTAKGLAVPVQNALVIATEDVDRGLKYRDDLYVLNGTHMPAILVEGGFISHPDTEEKLGSKEYQEIIADAVVEGIFNYLDMSTSEPDSKPESPPITTMPEIVTITIDAPPNVEVKVINRSSANKKS